jgi:hypothetical protein
MRFPIILGSRRTCNMVIPLPTAPTDPIGYLIGHPAQLYSRLPIVPTTPSANTITNVVCISRIML